MRRSKRLSYPSSASCSASDRITANLLLFTGLSGTYRVRRRVRTLTDEGARRWPTSRVRGGVSRAPSRPRLRGAEAEGRERLGGARDALAAGTDQLGRL